MSTVETTDMAAIALADLDRELIASIPCEGTYHRDGTRGHDRGPAQYMVSMKCPSCGKRGVFAFCAGRIACALGEAVQGRELRCSRCESSAPVLEIWRQIVPLSLPALRGGIRS